MARRQEGARLLATQATTALTPQDTVVVGGVREGGLLLEVGWKKGEGGKKVLTACGDEIEKTVGETGVSRVRNGKESDKGDGCERVGENDEFPSGLTTVGVDGYSQCGGTCQQIDGYGQELCFPGFVAEFFDDGGREEAEGVERNGLATHDESREPKFPIQDGVDEICPFEIFARVDDFAFFCTGILLQTATDDVFFIVVQEFAGFWRVGKKPVRGDTDEGGHDAFEDEAAQNNQCVSFERNVDEIRPA